MAVKVEDLCQAVLELRDAAVGGGGTGKTLLVQGMECAANSIFVEVHDRIAVGFLIGGVQDGIQRERIVLGGGDLFFDERAENAKLNLVELHVYKVPQVVVLWCRQLSGSSTRM